MSAEDEGYLEKMNQAAKRSNSPQCKIDDFELIMDHFENTAQQRQPFLSIDVTNILSYEEMETSFDGAISEKLRSFTKHIYQHWKEQKIAREGRAIIPVLKVFLMFPLCIILPRADEVCSLSKVMKKMMVIHMFVSAAVKFDRSERPEERTLRAPTRSRNYDRILILLGILSRMFCSVKLCGRVDFSTKPKYLNTVVP